VHRRAHAVLLGHPPQLAHCRALNALLDSSMMCLVTAADTALWGRTQVRLERRRAHSVVLDIPHGMEQPHVFPALLVSTTRPLLDPPASSALRGHIPI
jgi:hypothetical protein